MKKISLILIFVFCTALIESKPLPLQQLIDIQLELAYFEAKRALLTTQVSSTHRKEINEEVRSMHQMMTYHWNEFVTEIKKAESDEKIAKEKQLELRSIENRLFKLHVEAVKLVLSSPNGK